MIVACAANSKAGALAQRPCSFYMTFKPRETSFMIDWAKHLPKSAQYLLWAASLAGLGAGAYFLLQ